MAAVRKCLVWDLDQTLWDGVCLEGRVTVRDASVRSLRTLDGRGVLQSIASRGEPEAAWTALRSAGLDSLFVAPRVNWLPKPTNLVAIARELGIAVESLAFVDDDPFEREQVAAMLPGVAVFDAARVAELPDSPEFASAPATREARNRRLYYRAEADRNRAAAEHGDRAEFLRACRMRLAVRPMLGDDVPRVLELMTRTHQLNTTGLLLAPEEVRAMVAGAASGRIVRVADLEDRFGPYGTIGVAVVAAGGGAWTLEFLALSCRVMGRGIERAFLGAVMEEAKSAGASRLDAHFRATDTNRAMRALYQMAGLREDHREVCGGRRVFQRPLDDVPVGPPWVEVT